MASKGHDWSQSSSGNQSDLDSSMLGIDKMFSETSDSATPGSVFNYNVNIQVPIGPRFQVEVPDWTGIPSESDTKWLGTRIWALEKKLSSGKMASEGHDWSQSSSGKQSDLDSSMLGIDKLFSKTFDSATPGSLFNYDVNIQVPIGPRFQVEVPDWTGVPSESDTKWLGTRIWPLEKKENRLLIERDRIGKGRQDSCGCPLQGSIQCVKFHVAEKRLKLKLELGSAFNHWKFDKMGEEVAFAWKEEEKKMFSSIVKSNPPSLEKCLWDEIYKYFHNKSREELVCYYYNVFLLQRRAYQNRITPSNINSDDEEAEAEAESVAKGIGHKSGKS